MAEYKYSYSIQGDTPNKKVATDRLTQEILKSAITVALDRINTSGDILDVFFKDVLSQDEHSDLTTIISNHSGEPLPQNIPQDIIIKAAEIVVPQQIKGFPDYSGYPRLVKGGYGVALAGQKSYFYTYFNKKVKIQGGTIWVENKAVWGDYIDVDLTYGVDGPIVGQFVESVYMRPGQNTYWECFSEDAQDIPVGVCLRLGYTSVGEEDIKIIFDYRLRRTPNV